MSSGKRAASCRSRRLQDLANEISQLGYTRDCKAFRSGQDLSHVPLDSTKHIYEISSTLVKKHACK